MTFLEDYITFTIDKRYEDVAKSGIILINTAWIDDEESDRFIHKRLYGTVISVPLSYSDTKIRAIDPGLPQTKLYVGHDWIMDKINRGYKNHSNTDYYPSTVDSFEFVTMYDLSRLVDIQPGDRIYFDEKITEPENFLGMHQGKEYFKAAINEIFCVVRGGEILMQSGWVLVEPDMETWEEITTPSGIITKVKPEAKALRGFIRHIRNRNDMKPGQHIIYVSDADWTIKVEGKEYYVIQENDIIGSLSLAPDLV